MRAVLPGVEKELKAKAGLVVTLVLYIFPCIFLFNMKPKSSTFFVSPHSTQVLGAVDSFISCYSTAVLGSLHNPLQLNYRIPPSTVLRHAIDINIPLYSHKFYGSYGAINMTFACRGFARAM